LRFPASKKSPLYLLARGIKNCIHDSGLKKGFFESFKPHLSLGKFIKSNGKPLPKSDNLGWVPKIDFTLPEGSFVVDRIVFTVREKIEDKKAGTVTYKEYPAQLFHLKPMPKQEIVPQVITLAKEPEQKLIEQKAAFMSKKVSAAQKPKSDVESKKFKAATLAQTKVRKPVVHKLFKGNKKGPFAAAFHLRKGGVVPSKEEVQKEIQNLLEKEALKNSKVNQSNLQSAAKTLIYVQGLFDKALLNQKPTDPVFKLSESDTMIFNEFPKSLKKDILSGRRIILTQPHKPRVNKSIAVKENQD